MKIFQDLHFDSYLKLTVPLLYLQSSPNYCPSHQLSWSGFLKANKRKVNDETPDGEDRTSPLGFNVR